VARSTAPTVVSDDEAALVAAVAAGDRRDALPELYTRYEGRLYGLGCRLLGDTSLAEELVQETFVRLWRKASQYDPERGSVRTFIFAIARRIAVDLWRRPSSRPFEPEAEEGDAGPGRGVSTDPVEGILVGLTVRDALDSLSGPHREVLELGYRHGLKQAEIADRLGVPLGTVKTRTYHALRALKAALEERGGLVDV
jgi:RNA polymerase sigma-70 factor (ECF subfamily)